METDNIIENATLDNEIPDINDFIIQEDEDDNISDLKVVKEKVPSLDKSKTKEKIDKKDEDKIDLKNQTISEMANKYGVDSSVIDKKVSKYKKFSLIRDSLSKDATKDFIKEAIYEKKKNDEDILVDNIINSVVKGVLRDIRDDKTLESINKKNIYKQKYLNHAKEEILECIERWSVYIQNEDVEGIQRIKNSNIFKRFMEIYGIINLEPDVVSYQKMFYGNEGEAKFIKLISIFWGNSKESAKIRKLSEEVSKLKLRMDSVFAL